MAAVINLDQINRASREEFTRLLDGTYEHSPWIAERAWQARPFRTLSSLKRALIEAVRNSAHAEKLALIRAHPELAGKAAIAKQLTAESTAEQASAGLDKLTPEEFRGYCKGNALKYISRAGKKGSAREDAAKAAWYLRELIREEQNNGGE